MKIFNTNQNNSERVLRVLLALFLLPTPLILGPFTYSYVLSIIGAVLLFNGLIGTCYIYRVLGVNTCNT